MIIPTQPLVNGQSYSVTSAATSRTLATLTPGQLRRLSAGSTRNAADSQPLAGADQSFDNVLTQLETETGVSSGATLTFLRAVEDDFRTNYRRVSTTDVRRDADQGPHGERWPDHSSRPLRHLAGRYPGSRVREQQDRHAGAVRHSGHPPGSKAGNSGPPGDRLPPVRAECGRHANPTQYGLPGDQSRCLGLGRDLRAAPGVGGGRPDAHRHRIAPRAVALGGADPDHGASAADPHRGHSRQQRAHGGAPRESEPRSVLEPPPHDPGRRADPGDPGGARPRVGRGHEGPKEATATFGRRPGPAGRGGVARDP